MRAINTLLEITIYSGILFCAIMLLKLFFKNRMSPFMHFSIWGLLIMRLLVPVTLESSVHLFVIPAVETTQQQEQTPDSNTELMPNMNTSNSGQTQPQTNIQSAATSSTVTDNPSATRQTAPLSTGEILLAVWLTGAGIGVLYLAALYVLLRRRIQRNAQAPTKHLLKLFDEVKAELNIKRDVKLIGQCEYGTPAILFPNIVLMPVGTVVSMSDEEVKFVLRHELMHFKRCDHIMGLLLSLLNAVYWFNPIIWLTFRQIHADMETACDSDVVRYFSGREKTAYAAVILSLFSRKQYGNLALGMVRGDTKQIAERRIRGVFMNHKSNKKVKIAAIALASLLLFTCFTTACQPTPGEGAVVGKDGQSLEDAIKLSGTQIQDYQVPDRCTDYLETDNLAVTIDADVALPKATSIAAAKAKAKEFTPQEIEKIMEVLTDGQILYEYNEQLTKDEVQQRILECKREKAQLAKSTDLGNEHEGTINLELYDQMIEEYEMMMEDAPEEITLIPTSSSDLIETSFIGQTESREIISVNSSSSGFEISYSNGVFLNRSYNRTCNETFDGLTLSQEKAVEFASELVDKLGVTGMEITSVATDDSYNNIDNAKDSNTEKVPFYQIVFTRAIEGVPTTYECRYMTTENEYANTCYYERIYVFVNDDGVMQFEWYNPLEIIEVLNTSVSLKSFDEIMNTTKQQIINENSYFVDERIDGMKITVDTIQLGMMAVQVEGEADSYLFIPVWDFFGSYSLHYDDPPDWEGMSEDGWKLSDNIAKSFLTINAIDGSIIDRDLGY